MFGFDDAILAGGAASAIGAGLNWWGQRDANRTNEDIAKNQQDFQERMANTSWQRGVADMRAAGINPMLAVSKGGADVPSGAALPVQNTFSNAIPALHSAAALMTKKAELDNMRMQNQQIGSQIQLNTANAHSALAQADLYKNNAVLAGKKIPGATNQAAVDNTWFGRALPYVRGVTGAIGDVVGAAMPVSQLARNLLGSPEPSSVGSYTSTRRGDIYNRHTGEIVK